MTLKRLIAEISRPMNKANVHSLLINGELVCLRCLQGARAGGVPSLFFLNILFGLCMCVCVLWGGGEDELSCIYQFIIICI